MHIYVWMMIDGRIVSCGATRVKGEIQIDAGKFPFLLKGNVLYWKSAYTYTYIEHKTHFCPPY
jgi:hypothetical protein